MKKYIKYVFIFLSIINSKFIDSMQVENEYSLESIGDLPTELQHQILSEVVLDKIMHDYINDFKDISFDHFQ